MKFQAQLPRPSRDNATLLPALLAGALVLMAALQFALPAEAELPAQTGGSVQRALADRQVTRAIPDPVILRNALFAPGRANGGANVAAAGPLDGAVAVGMVRGRGFARAVLQQSDGSAVSVAVGGRYRGWRLIGLTKVNAIFTRDGVRVAMAFSNGTIQPNTAFQTQRADEQ